MTSPYWSQRVAQIADLIRGLTPHEVRALREMLEEDPPPPGPDIGVREPRRPKPTAGGSQVVIPLPEGEEDEYETRVIPDVD